jgi:heptosyltransferase II
MKILIAKLGATGDVVRTTTLLRRFPGSVTWITAAKNTPLLKNIDFDVRCLSWEERDQAADCEYDLAINLEDTLDVAGFVKGIRHKQLFGAYADAQERLCYTDDSNRWFDLSLISRYGRERADQLKYENRATYQELIFQGLGAVFNGEKYVLPTPPETDLRGDIALATESGPVWPMKKWAYYDELKTRLEEEGFTVNVLPQRKTLLEHLGDVKNHRCVVGGDSLPMHFALGMDVRVVSIFTCTSPWEIYEYGIMTKLISPLLGEFFYKRTFDVRATNAISLNEVLAATHEQMRAASPASVSA